ncbi:MAG: hypothetical protein EXX96DRAFT_610977 [Benjaminiella poitrasii]|nr:MAG: hypothetical protein EXX96DRAFT_610977 [Benjaminiella poitrasii]
MTTYLEGIYDGNLTSGFFFRKTMKYCLQRLLYVQTLFVSIAQGGFNPFLSAMNQVAFLNELKHSNHRTHYHFLAVTFLEYPKSFTTTTVKPANVSHLADYSPIVSTSLADPQYKDLTNDVRIVTEKRSQHLVRALFPHIRKNICRAVATEAWLPPNASMTASFQKEKPKFADFAVKLIFCRIARNYSTGQKKGKISDDQDKSSQRHQDTNTDYYRDDFDHLDMSNMIPNIVPIGLERNDEPQPSSIDDLLSPSSPKSHTKPKIEITSEIKITLY